LSNSGWYATFLSGADLSSADLAGANFTGAYLTGAEFAGADVRGARFGIVCGPGAEICIGTGITLAQLYSTASYQAHDLRGIGLNSQALAGGNFAGQNFANADFAGALSYANLTAVDARGAILYGPSVDLAPNLIRPDGHINGLDLDVGALLVVRDYDGNPTKAGQPVPITVDQRLSMGPGGTLRMVFEADAWDSTISFAPGIAVTLGGTLELTFADDVNLASQVGRTLDLFDWTGVTPTGAFAVSSTYAWDLSNLYTTGEVTLAAIPEPRALRLFCFALTALIATSRVRMFF
jgi:hypothetical protein